MYEDGQYEYELNKAKDREHGKIVDVDFGTFTENEMIASGTYEVGTVVRDKTRYNSKGELYVVTEVGRSWTANPADPTFMQSHRVLKIMTGRELYMVRLGFKAGWDMSLFYDSHMSQEVM